MPPETRNVRELTRRLVAREAAKSDAPESALIALRSACERTYRELARWLGPTGSHTLLTRAVAEAREEHPVLREIRVGHEESVLHGLTGVVEAHGAAAVTAALEAVLVTLLSLLGRLVGDDVAARLVEQDMANHSPHDENLT